MKRFFLLFLFLSSTLFCQFGGNVTPLGVPGLHQALDYQFALNYNGLTKYLSVTPKYIQKGVNLLAGWDFTNWSRTINATSSTPSSFVTTDYGGVNKVISLITLGKKFRIIISGTTTASSLEIKDKESITLYKTLSGTFTNQVIDFVSQTSEGLYFRNASAGTTTITKFELYEASESLSFNDNEMILNSGNRDFESATDWVGHGNNTIQTSTEQKHAGSNALKLTSTGIGDATTNYTSLAYSKYDPILSGHKYTKQLWVYPSVSCSITVNLGDITKTFAVTANTWQLCPYTFTATSGTVNQPLKIWASQASTIYVDDVSLSEYHPFTFVTCFKTNSSNEIALLYKKASSSAGFTIEIIAGKFYITSHDGVNYSTLNSTATVNDNLWHMGVVTQDLTLPSNNTKIYIDNTLQRTATFVMGNTNNSQNLCIGRASSGPSYFYQGSMGYQRIIRDYTYTQSDVDNEKRLGLRYRPQGQVALQLDYLGSTTSEMLQDRSSVGNNAVGANIDITDRVRLIK
jgi:hypothetical protein